METAQTGAVASERSAREVVVFELGPIGPLMDAARKAQDLAAASAVVTAVACAALRAMADAGGQLVAPPAKPKDDSQPVTDRLVAVCSQGAGKAVGEVAKDAARRKLKEIAKDARKRIGTPSGFDQNRFDHQVDTFLDLGFAVATFAEDGQFGEARNAAMEALDGRRVLFDFAANQAGGGGRPKSALDGRLEAVFNANGAAYLQRRFGAAMMNTNEVLDALGVACRFWDGARQERRGWKSVAKVALAPFMRESRRNLELFELICGVDDCRDELNKAVQKGVCVGDGEAPAEGARFIDDDWGVLLHPSEARSRDLAEVLAGNTGVGPRSRRLQSGDSLGELAKPLNDFEDSLARFVRAAKKKGFMPSPYYAIVAADGDNVGAGLKQLASVDQSRWASEKLSAFSVDVRKTAGRDADEGQFKDDVEVIYAGGDDVLALVSLDRAIPFAEKIHGLFDTHMGNLWDEVKLAADKRNDLGRPSLSVGIAIVHVADALQASISLAQKALEAAKRFESDDGREKKNALAITLSRRSGADRTAVLSWTTRPETTLAEMVEVFRKYDAPRGLPYELRRRTEVLVGVPEKVAIRELIRVLERRRGRKGEVAMPEHLLKTILALGELKWCEKDEAQSAAAAPDAKRFGDLNAPVDNMVNALLVAVHLAQYTQPEQGGEQ